MSNAFVIHKENAFLYIVEMIGLYYMKKIYKYYLHIYSFPALLIGIVGAILFCSFCSSCASREDNPLLLRADSLMAAQPDSALWILENGFFPQKMSRKDNALYALLLTQARHKNYIVLDSDSLIKIAVDYYGDTKKSFPAAQAHYYWGAVYRDMGHIPFAVEEYLKAIQLMPDNKASFLAIIYDNLAECYQEEELYDVAMGAYEKAYQILYKDKKQLYYPLRGIASLFLFQNQLDSALCYYQKAYDLALATQDSSKLAILYSDFATAYLEKKEYIRANEYASKAISMLNSDDLYSAYFLKGQIMLDLNQLDSARYYFDKNRDEQDIYKRVARYNGLYQIEKKKKNWEAALQNADVYMILYDSIQELSDNLMLDKLMDNYELEKHKSALSQHSNRVMGHLASAFLLFFIIGGSLFLWNDRRRKKRYMALQDDLLQKRVDTMLLREKKASESGEGDANILTELHEQQLQICLSMFQSTDCYEKLRAMENATPKQLIAMRNSVSGINVIIRKTFIDVMSNLKECCPNLTNDDLFYCVLSLLHCSKIVIMELMDASQDALKVRKNRVKNEMEIKLFDRVFYR